MSLVERCIDTVVSNLADVQTIEGLPAVLADQLADTALRKGGPQRFVSILRRLVMIRCQLTRLVLPPQTTVSHGLTRILIGFSNMTTLDLTGSEITTKGLRELLPLARRLKSLILHDCKKITDLSLQMLGQEFVEMEEIDVGGCSLITVQGLIKMVKHPHMLLSLKFDHCPLIGDDDDLFTWLQCLVNMQVLDFGFTACTTRVLGALPLEQLRYLGIGHLKGETVTSDCLVTLSACQSLRHLNVRMNRFLVDIPALRQSLASTLVELNLSHTGCTDLSLSMSLPLLLFLTTMDLSFTSITISLLPILENIASLKKLNITATRIDPDRDLQKLEALRSKLTELLM